MSRVDPRWISNTEVFQAMGSVDDMVIALSRILASGHWREFEHPMQGLKRFERLSDYCEAFLQVPATSVVGLLDRSTLPQAAGEVRRALLEDVPPAAKHGGKREQVDNINLTSKGGGSGEEYLLRRLKRDRPDLAQQVIDGTLTAHAAAVQAGIRRRYLQVPADDAEAAIRKVSEHYGITLHASP